MKTESHKETVQILIAEDSPTQAEALRHMLEAQGYGVTVARNGRIALSEAWNQRPQLVISDIVMPDMDGFGLCKALRAEEHLKDVPVILMTSLSSPDDVIKGLEAGADNFIRKPYNAEYLLSRVEYILSNRKLRASSKVGMEMEILLGGRKHRITSERQQILDLLISTYEDAVNLNAQLIEKQEQFSRLTEELEKRVEERTEALRTEVDVRTRAEAGFRALLEAAPDAILGVNDRGCITFANVQTETLFLYPREELLGAPVEMLVPEALRRAHESHRGGYSMQPVRRTMGSGLTLRGRRKDGSLFPVEVSLSPIDNESGVGVISIIRDITERIAAEESLRASEARYRQLVEVLPDAILINRDNRFVFCNSFAVRLLGGAGKSEILGKSTEDIVPPDFHEMVRLRIQHMLETGQPAPLVEAQFVKVDGSRVDVEVTSIPIMFEGAAAAQVIAHDITERKKLEEQVRQAQKMEAIGSLAGGVAHDFNNLLNVILGYGELALDRLQDADPLRRYVTEMREAAERAASLTRQLLAFSRRQVLEPRVLDLNTVVGGMEKMLHRLIGEDVTLRTALAPDLGRVKADPTQLEQVIMNLAVNARDAMPKGGNLTISTSNAELDQPYVNNHVGAQAGSYVMLAVSDSGTGMPPEVQKRIFEPFFTTKEKGKGTGLGLSTVYGIVKQSNGSIWVYSEAGKGTAFKVYLPRIMEKVGVAEKAMPGLDTFCGTETILLVEDAAALRELAREFLQTSGYTVLEAASGPEALVLASQHAGDIQVLLTDVIMPGMSGAELAQRMLEATPSLRVIYVSGYTADAISHHGVLAEGVMLLEKPYTKEKLLRTIREALARPGDGS